MLRVLYNSVKVIPDFFPISNSGKLYSFIIPLPQVNLKGGIEAFKEAIAKGEVKVERVLDEADNVILDEEGNILNKAITKEGEEVELLEKVVNQAGSWVSTFPKLAGKLDAWKPLELVFEQTDDFVRILSKTGDEVAKVVKNGSDEVFEIADDFFRATPSNPATPITEMTVKANTGETIIGAGFFKNADGSIGFVEDVSSYGGTIVQNTIKNRGGLRGTINGIQVSEDAHHLFPIQSLKENQWIKKGVEGGFEFNTGSVNGLGIEKYVKATGAGRHGPHPQLTKQIQDHMDWWANQTVNGVKNSSLTATQTADYMRGLANSLRNKINTSTIKLNDLKLNLPH